MLPGEETGPLGAKCTCQADDFPNLMRWRAEQSGEGIELLVKAVCVLHSLVLSMSESLVQESLQQAFLKFYVA
jgi:hypothetical protein